MSVPVSPSLKKAIASCENGEVQCRRCLAKKPEQSIRIVQYAGSPDWTVCSMCTFDLTRTQKNMIVWDHTSLKEPVGPWLALPRCNTCGKYEQSPGYEQCGPCLGLPFELPELPPELRSYYSKKLLERLVPALEHATHGLSTTP